MTASSLPQWTAEGLLPPGAHRTDQAGIYERLVQGERNREIRESLFRALVLHLEMLQELVPHGTAWIDGGFCMRKEEPPGDVDVVFFPEDWDAFASRGDEVRDVLFGLLTLQGVIVEKPWSVALERIQPIGGRVDSFIQPPAPQVMGYWFELWSAVKRDGAFERDKVKGFAEVVW